MLQYHSLLQRQLSKHLDKGHLSDKTLCAVFALISQTYRNFDADRALTERSLELSSQELNEVNAELKTKLKPGVVKKHRVFLLRKKSNIFYGTIIIFSPSLK